MWPDHRADTAHVPCKFFKLGQCQAGSACPFSHDTVAEVKCKYFEKVSHPPSPLPPRPNTRRTAADTGDPERQGNCKFGPKCANIHILPDGRRVYYHKGTFTTGPPSAATLNLGNRVAVDPYPHSSTSALTNSFMGADGGGGGLYPAGGAYPFNGDHYEHHLGRQPSLENGFPGVDTTPIFGSPRDEPSGRYGLSPVNKGIQISDVGLPASFDPNRIHSKSHAIASSVPTKFPATPPSVSRPGKDSWTSDTLRRLHDSSGLGQDPLSAAPANDGAMGSSPPAVGMRAMHSSSWKINKPRAISSSYSRVLDNPDGDLHFGSLEEEADCIPESLANDVLTPEEKARRGSMRMTDAELQSVTFFGSPKGGGASPGSRWAWGQLPSSPRTEDELGSSLGRAMRSGSSAFGHVGSPLRNSSLAIDLGRRESLEGVSDGSGRASKTNGEPVSALTQQLRMSRLADDSSASSSPHLHPNSARTAGLATGGAARERPLERHVSSGSIGSGRVHTPIDEESLFDMTLEDEEDQSRPSSKRRSGGNGVLSYAAVAGVNGR
jgi:hypothetical protein